MIKSVYSNTALFGVEEAKLRPLEKLLMSLEGQLLDGVILQVQYHVSRRVGVRVGKQHLLHPSLMFSHCDTPSELEGISGLDMLFSSYKTMCGHKSCQFPTFYQFCL